MRFQLMVIRSSVRLNLAALLYQQKTYPRQLATKRPHTTANIASLMHLWR